MSHKRIPLPGILNLRDLGGYPMESGGFTRYGAYLRSALPEAVCDESIAYLRDYGVTTVIDLRTEYERAQDVCALMDIPGITYHGIQIIDDATTPVKDFNVPDSYLRMIRYANFAKMLHVLAEARGTVLYHCAAGKDRTGVTSALLLMLAGVSDLDIIADYEVSCTYITPLLERLRAMYPDLPETAGHSKPEYIKPLLKALCDTPGGAAGYLQSIGLSQTEIASLRSRLTGE